MSERLDKTDRAIIALLQQDARIPNVQLAERVNLSESACLRRVRSLQERGVIRAYRAVIDEAAVGYSLTVFVQITLAHQQNRSLAEFESAVAAIDEVVDCYLMTGDADYLLHVIASDANDYERIHSQHLTRLPGVDRVRSSFALRAVKRAAPIVPRAAPAG